jgi:hypothetical protein
MKDKKIKPLLLPAREQNSFVRCGNCFSKYAASLGFELKFRFPKRNCDLFPIKTLAEGEISCFCGG